MKRLLLLTLVSLFLCDINVVDCEPTTTIEDESSTDKEEATRTPLFRTTWEDVAFLCLLGVILGTGSFFYPFVSGDASSLSEALELSLNAPSPRILDASASIGWFTRRFWEFIVWYLLGGGYSG